VKILNKIRPTKSNSADAQHLSPLDKTPLSVASTLGAQLIRVVPSTILLVIVLSLHTCALIGVVLTNIPLWLIILCIVLLFVHAGVYCHIWRQSPPYRLQASQGNRWIFYSEQDNNNFLVIKSCYYWSRYIVIFRVENQRGRSLFFPIFADSCLGQHAIREDHFRHLRVLAKYFLS